MNNLPATGIREKGLVLNQDYAGCLLETLLQRFLLTRAFSAVTSLQQRHAQLAISLCEKMRKCVHWLSFIFGISVSLKGCAIGVFWIITGQCFSTLLSFWVKGRGRKWRWEMCIFNCGAVSDKVSNFLKRVYLNLKISIPLFAIMSNFDALPKFFEFPKRELNSRLDFNFLCKVQNSSVDQTPIQLYNVTLHPNLGSLLCTEQKRDTVQLN